MGVMYFMYSMVGRGSECISQSEEENVRVVRAWHTFQRIDQLEFEHLTVFCAQNVWCSISESICTSELVD